MSMTAMIGTMAQRDAGGPKRAKKSPKSKQEAEETEAQSYLGVLVNAIPTELLALYTFVIAAIVATIDDPKESPLEALRWVLYGVTIVIIAAWLLAAYFRRPKADRKRKLPVAEVLAPMVAFAAWGLAMPESPLSIKYSGDDLTIRTTLVTAAGVLLLGFIGGSLKKPAKISA